MSKVMLSESYLEDIADAIRAKTGTQDTYTPGEMPEAIESISGGGITPTGTISITTNGTVDVTQYASANVNVPSVTPTGTINITQNGTVDVTNYASASVAVPNPSTGTKQISINQNGTTTEDVTNYASAEITVNVGSKYEDFSGGNIKAIISTGTQYIVTDYMCPLGALFSIKLADNNTTNYEGYFSTAKGSKTTGMQRNSANQTITIKFAGTELKGISYPGYSDGEPITVTFSTIGLTTDVSDLGLVICGSYYNGALEATKGRFTFYGLNIFDGTGTLLKRFRPWLENGVACMKELGTGTIYQNTGTGTFGYIDSEGVTHNAT